MGPALLVAVSAIVGAMRVPVAIVVAMVLPSAPLVALVLAFAVSFDISEVWFQLGAFPAAGLVTFRLRRALTLPPTRFREVRYPAVAFSRFPIEELKIGVATIGGGLLLLVPLWY